MSYKLIQTNKSKRKLKRLKKSDKIVYDNVKKGLYSIQNNPHNMADIQLTSKKCPKCRRHRVGNYRIIYYIHSSEKIVEIVDIIARKDDYMLY